MGIGLKVQQPTAISVCQVGNAVIKLVAITKYVLLASTQRKMVLVLTVMLVISAQLLMVVTRLQMESYNVVEVIIFYTQQLPLSNVVLYLLVAIGTQVPLQRLYAQI